MNIFDVVVDEDNASNMISEPQGTYFSIEFKSDFYDGPLELVLRKPRTNNEWEFYYIGNFEYNITGELSNEEINFTLKSLISRKDVQETLQHLSIIQEQEFLRYNSKREDVLFQSGERIWRKIRKEINCGFNVVEGDFAFVLPYMHENIPNEIRTNFARILSFYNNEDEFVIEAIKQLKMLEEKHESA